MKKSKSLIISLILALLTAVPAMAGTITFEDMPQDYWYYGGQQNFGNYWEGVSFGPASTILESTVYGYNNSGYPAHSGDSVLFSINLGYIDAIFDNPVDFVSMWYSSSSYFYLEAYDIDNNLITSTVGGANLYTNALIQVSSNTKNIKWVKMHDTGNYFTIDDFSAEFVSGNPNNPVPEPSTLLLLGGGLAGLAFARRRFVKK